MTAPCCAAGGSGWPSLATRWFPRSTATESSSPEKAPDGLPCRAFKSPLPLRGKQQDGHSAPRPRAGQGWATAYWSGSMELGLERRRSCARCARESGSVGTRPLGAASSSWVFWSSGKNTGPGSCRQPGDPWGGGRGGRAPRGGCCPAARVPRAHAGRLPLSTEGMRSQEAMTRGCPTSR